MKKKDLEQRIFEIELRENKLQLPKETVDFIIENTSEDSKEISIFLYNGFYKTKYGEYFCIYAIPQKIFKIPTYKNDIIKATLERFNDGRKRKYIGLHLPKEVIININNNIVLPNDLMQKAQIKPNTKCVIVQKDYGLQIHESNLYYATH